MGSSVAERRFQYYYCIIFFIINTSQEYNNYWPLPVARWPVRRTARCTARTTARPATSAAAPYRISFCSPTHRPAYHISPPPVCHDCACVPVCVSARARLTGGGSDDDDVPTLHPPVGPFISATAANHCSRAALAP